MYISIIKTNNLNLILIKKGNTSKFLKYKNLNVTVFSSSLAFNSSASSPVFTLKYFKELEKLVKGIPDINSTFIGLKHVMLYNIRYLINMGQGAELSVLGSTGVFGTHTSITV